MFDGDLSHILSVSGLRGGRVYFPMVKAVFKVVQFGIVENASLHSVECRGNDIWINQWSCLGRLQDSLSMNSEKSSNNF